MSAEENNMALARRLIEARVGGDLDALDEMLTPDFVTHTKLVPGQQPGREGEKWAITQLTAAFSNRSVVVEDQVALPPPLRGPAGIGGRGRHRPWRTRRAGDVHDLRHVAARRSSLGLLLAWGGA